MPVAISIAVSAALRSGTGSRPMPTTSRSVQPSTAAVAATPLPKKQSAQTTAPPGRALRQPAPPAPGVAAADRAGRSGPQRRHATSWPGQIACQPGHPCLVGLRAEADNIDVSAGPGVLTGAADF